MCMRSMPCMQCPICKSLGDVWGDGFYPLDVIKTYSADDQNPCHHAAFASVS